MKKNGFTLAEVLITLAIIGVVATMTLPSLMTNTAEQQAKSAFKKGINTLTEAAQMSQAIDGYSYESLTSDDTTSDAAQSLFGLLARRTQIDFARSKTGGHTGDSGNFAVFFRDGSILTFPGNATGNATTAAEMQDDNLPYGIEVLYDTNGLKGPNQISNCQGSAAGISRTGGSDTGDASLCNVKANRVIKDQFGIRLRGGYAVPNGAAAKWVFEN